jgi:hypothetical protein
VEALESKVRSRESGWTVSTEGSTLAPPSRPTAPTLEEAARRQIVVGLTTEPAGAEHRAAVVRVAELLLKSVGPPVAEKEFTWAVGVLDRESHRDRVTPQEAQDLASVLAGLPAGHAARPSLAKAAAIGWSRDEHLGVFLAQFPANAEPSLHQGVLAALDDEHPSPAFSEYVLRVVREERDPSVLATALGLDRIEAAATVVAAPRLAEVIETRDAKMRAHAGLALAVASLRIPETGIAALRRVADREADSKVAEKDREAAAALQTGSATLKSLERLFE